MEKKSLPINKISKLYFDQKFMEFMNLLKYIPTKNIIKWYIIILEVYGLFPPCPDGHTYNNNFLNFQILHFITNLYCKWGLRDWDMGF